MSVWELPTSLEIGGVGFPIRSDFRAILDILKYFQDPDYEDDEKMMICLAILFPDWEDIPQEHVNEAVEKAYEFIDAGNTPDGKPSPHIMDWEQDAPLIIPAINRVVGQEVRTLPFLHWWTFLGAYMEIGECLYANVISVRSKKSKGKKLEDYEKEFYRNNKKLVDLRKKYSEDEQAEINRLNSLI